MLTVLINDQVFQVDSGYMDEPLDTIYPLYSMDDDSEPAGTMRADMLQKVAIKVPNAYTGLYRKKIKTKISEALDSIDVRVVLRLLVHNERYMHYIVGPVLMEDLLVREGGYYFAFANDKANRPILYSGDSGLQLRECIKMGIPSIKNPTVQLAHDQYFDKAIATLLEMHNGNDLSLTPEYVSMWKEALPAHDFEHPRHCQWCEEQGLSITHSH